MTDNTTTEVKKAHVAHNSGNNEWYTPDVYLDLARKVMGEIDLDPASCAKANDRVKAIKFYSQENDGLQNEWGGKVWMNPPYKANLIGKFANKLAESYESKTVLSAIVLVNNATETKWFRTLVNKASAVCFPYGRVRFLDPEGNLGAPLQGQAILYFGDSPETFVGNFSSIGWCANVCRQDNERLG